LEKEFNGKTALGTPLTQDNRKKGREPYRLKTEKQRNSPKIENRCIQCGKPALDDNLYCPDCYRDRQAELLPLFTSAGVNHLRNLREKGISVAHGGEAARKRGETQKIRNEARNKWEEAHPGLLYEEKKRFIREIQPVLKSFSIREIARACNCSFRYASLIREGNNVPHPVFYKDLEELIIQIN
jgi:hypothetical protein